MTRKSPPNKRSKRSVRIFVLLCVLLLVVSINGYLSRQKEPDVVIGDRMKISFLLHTTYPVYGVQLQWYQDGKAMGGQRGSYERKGQMQANEEISFFLEPSNFITQVPLELLFYLIDEKGEFYLIPQPMEVEAGIGKTYAYALSGNTRDDLFLQLSKIETE